MERQRQRPRADRRTPAHPRRSPAIRSATAGPPCPSAYFRRATWRPVARHFLSRARAGLAGGGDELGGEHVGAHPADSRRTSTLEAARARSYAARIPRHLRDPHPEQFAKIFSYIRDTCSGDHSSEMPAAFQPGQSMDREQSGESPNPRVSSRMLVASASSGSPGRRPPVLLEHQLVLDQAGRGPRRAHRRKASQTSCGGTFSRP